MWNDGTVFRILPEETLTPKVGKRVCFVKKSTVMSLFEYHLS